MKNFILSFCAALVMCGVTALIIVNFILMEEFTMMELRTVFGISLLLCFCLMAQDHADKEKEKKQ